MTRPKAIVSWSSGKDSAFALVEAQRELDIVGTITTITTAFGRVSMHGVREALLDRQLAELGLPCRKIGIPSPCPNDVYERELVAALRSAQADGVTPVVFGDLFLADIRAYRERLLAPLGLVPVFPLWLRDTRQLARDMLDAGIAATITCVDPKQLDRSFAGRAFGAELPAGVDPCGEHGEFHTFVTAGPMFRRAIPIRVGETVERDGCVFTDLLP
jgi:uncharacterized protein (TIGR00290 family)